MSTGGNYTMKYRTFDSLLDDVSVDFRNITLENFIEPQQLIKVAKRVSYDLGLRIFQTKETVLDVEHGRVRLPDDFYVLNFGLICDSHTVNISPPAGTHLEDRILTQPVYQCVPEKVDLCTPFPPPGPDIPCDPCESKQDNCGSCNVKPCVRLNCKGQAYEVVHMRSFETRHYSKVYPLRIKANAKFVDCDCPGLHWNTPNSASIDNNFLTTSFREGKVYINYQGMLEDDDGNLMVPDHDLLNEYYEYALKLRILENLIMNDEPVGQKFQIVEQRYRVARNNALSVVNTPNFAEMKQVWEMNRKAQYGKYYDMFKSYSQLGFNDQYL